MTAYQKSIRSLLRLLLLFVAAGCISTFMPDVFLLRHSATLFLLAMAIALLLHFSERIIDRELRGCLTAIAAMLTFWILLRGAKYIAFQETEIIARHIWYLYYLPMLMIPQLSLYAALAVNRRPEEKTPPLKATLAVTIGLILLVLTNDLHGLVFRFQPGFLNWDADYTRGPLFFAVYLWLVLLLTAAMVILFHRCRLSESRRMIWIPVLPVAAGALYLVLYALDLWPRPNGILFGQFPEAVSFSLAGMWISLINIGAIPSNEGYGELFEASHLAAQITDRRFQTVYRSAGAAVLSPEQYRSVETLMPDKNTRLHRRPVQGGFVFWQDDITALNQIHAELEAVHEQLAEEAELLRLENALKEKRLQIEEKTRVYDEIAARVLPQSKRIAALCAEARENPARFEKNMQQVCLLGTFIKRCANLSLLASEKETAATDELHLAILESLRQVRAMNIPAEAFCGENILLSARSLLAAYIAFETLLEQALPTLTGITAVLSGAELKLTLEGAEVLLPEGIPATLTAEDGISYVRLALGKAGDAA